MTKEEIRKKILQSLSAQGPKARAQKDEAIRERLLALPEFKVAKVVAFYLSFGSEAETTLLIDRALAMGKKVAVPVIEGRDLKLSEIRENRRELEKGPYGIPQPDPKSLAYFPGEKIELAIVPGVAFTRSGLRLGRGKGYYDRFLKRLPAGIRRIGLAYDLQIVDSLPADAHDLPVDMVVTNKETLNSKH